MTRIRIPDVSLVDNTEERVPLVLALDCSGSMDGAPIAALNEGLKALEQDLKSDPIAAKRVRILVITFGAASHHEVEVGQWQDVMDFSAPTLEANGTTPTGAAVGVALDEIEREKAALREAGIAYKRPLLYLMSDGAPTDDWKAMAKRARQAEAEHKLSIFPIGVGNEVDTGVLGRFGARGAIQLEGLKFKELFMWLSASVKTVSQTTRGQAAQLPSANSWASVATS